MLQTLAGPVPAADGLNSALQSLRGGLRADETALVTADPADPADPDGSVTCRAYSGLRKETPAATLALARAAIDHAAIDRAATDRTDTDRTDTDRTATDRTATDCTATDRTAAASDGGKCLTVTFGAPGGQTALLARWDTDVPADDATDLMEDAARSLRLALEREEALAAQQETMALRRSRDMQHAFLRRLSHELRTPLTAITGYATSLLQPDVTWDAGTRHRFLTRIAAESARLGRLVNDLLDFSAIESGVFRLACDWCDLPLVIDAAVAVLPPDTAPMVEVRPGLGLPAIWADHDRLEQVFVNLIGNALVHNPPGTRVQVTVEAPGPHRRRDRHGDGDGERATDPDTGPVVVTVADDGTGIPPGTLGESPGPGRSRGLRPGAGLGLSIAQGIIEAHGGSMELVPAPKGTRFRITLPVEETEAM
jgi:signal transduction histidine kinase